MYEIKINEGKTKMTHLEFYRCDECAKVLDNCEASARQLMYKITECFDCNRTFHFCSRECLMKFANRPYKQWLNKTKEGEIVVHGRRR